MAIGVLATAVFGVPILVVYYPARLTVAAFDAGGAKLWALHVALINRDIARKHGCARKPGEARPDGWLP
jgi:hypothetical protein